MSNEAHLKGRRLGSGRRGAAGRGVARRGGAWRGRTQQSAWRAMGHGVVITGGSRDGEVAGGLGSHLQPTDLLSWLRCRSHYCHTNATAAARRAEECARARCSSASPLAVRQLLVRLQGRGVAVNSQQQVRRLSLSLCLCSPPEESPQSVAQI